jgi:hypothetical protein
MGVLRLLLALYLFGVVGAAFVFAFGVVILETVVARKWASGALWHSDGREK